MRINPDLQSQVRQPRGIVNVNGTRVDAWVRWSVDNNAYSEADTFQVTFALSALPAAFNDQFWSSATEVFLEVLGGFPGDADDYTAGELTSWIYGRVDDVDYDPVARQLHVSGRDLSAIMIDARTTESFQNMTASGVANLLAKRNGFTPVVTATKDLVGAYYETDTVRTNAQRSEWEVLTTLAAAEGFVVYVKGKELHFEPAAPVSQNVYELAWQPPTGDDGTYGFNGKSISFQRALHIARGVVVEVTFTMPNKKGTFTVRYPNKGTGIKVGQSAATAQLYKFTMLGVSRQAALNRAQREHAAITKHEVKVRAELPADDLLRSTSIVSVTGTGTAFDQFYYPESIVREMEFNTGYTMSFSGKNHSPETVVAE